MSTQLKLIMKKIFKFIRKIDKTVIRLLAVNHKYAPTEISVSVDSNDIFSILESYDQNTLEKYIRARRGSIILRLYLRVRNVLFVSCYRFFRKVVR